MVFGDNLKGGGPVSIFKVKTIENVLMSVMEHCPSK